MENLLSSFKTLSVEEANFNDVPTYDEIVKVLDRANYIHLYLLYKAREQLQELKTKQDEHWDKVKSSILFDKDEKEVSKDTLKPFVCYTDLVLSRLPEYQGAIREIIGNYRSFYNKTQGDYHPITYMFMDKPAKYEYCGSWRERSIRYNSGCGESEDYIIKIQYIINLCAIYKVPFNVESVKKLRKHWSGVWFGKQTQE